MVKKAWLIAINEPVRLVLAGEAISQKVDSSDPNLNWLGLEVQRSRLYHPNYLIPGTTYKFEFESEQGNQEKGELILKSFSITEHEDPEMLNLSFSYVLYFPEG